jgi:acyl carrier protein
VLNSETVRAVARQVTAEIAKQKVQDSQYLVSSGLIDSLSVLTLISKLEQRLGIHIPKQLVQPEDFDSVELIVETIQRVTS